MSLPTGGFLLVLPTGLGNTPDTASLIPEHAFRELKVSDDRLAHLHRIANDENLRASLRCPGFYGSSRSMSASKLVCLTLAYAVGGREPPQIQIIRTPRDLKRLGFDEIQLSTQVTRQDVTRTLSNDIHWITRYDFADLSYNEMKEIWAESDKELQFIRR